jgi:hypothetical protein
LNSPAYDIVVDLNRIHRIDALERHDAVYFGELLSSVEWKSRNVRSCILCTIIPIGPRQRNDPAPLPQRLLGLTDTLTDADVRDYTASLVVESILWVNTIPSSCMSERVAFDSFKTKHFFVVDCTKPHIDTYSCQALEDGTNPWHAPSRKQPLALTYPCSL